MSGAAFGKRFRSEHSTGVSFLNLLASFRVAGKLHQQSATDLTDGNVRAVAFAAS
jgi:hypothetical protein